MPGPLDGLQVLDLSEGMAGSLASAVLADFGADVVKIEPPSGDPARMFAVMRQTPKPCLAFKILAAGRVASSFRAVEQAVGQIALMTVQ